MFNRKDLQELAAYSSSNGAILSVYLNVDPTQHTRDEYKLALRGLLRKAASMGAAEQDISAVERFFELEYDWSGRGVAVFACAADDFWKECSLSVPLKNHVFVWNKPYITPLASAWDTYGRCVLGLVDRQGAKLMLYQLGELVKTEGIMGEEVRHIKAGGGSSAAGRRGGTATRSSKRESEVAGRNLKEAAELMVAFCETYQPRNVLLAGERETLKQFKARLPRVWADRVIGSLAADMATPEIDLRDKVFSVLEKVEREHEVALTDAVITAAGKGRGGVVTLDQTLSAAHGGQIQTLVVAEGYHAEGFQCQGCSYVTAQDLGACPFCGGHMASIPDAVEAIIGQVLELGGHVEVVADHAELNAAGIGALLRY
jgi:hypothetical protein